MSLAQAVLDPDDRSVIAADAVRQAELAIHSRTGVRATAAKVGLETIKVLRPGFLVRHMYLLLPAMAEAIDPHWSAGLASGDPKQHLERRADQVASDLLTVTDTYVAAASDTKATAVYHRLRDAAPGRIVEHMSRIASFVERHTGAG